MQKYILKLSSKNQITVPAAVRHALGVSSNERIAVVVDDHGSVTLRPADIRSIADLKGILPSLGRPTSPDFSVEIREAMDEAADKLVRDMGGL